VIRASVLAVAAGCATGHHHGPRAHPDDLRHIYVEIAATGELASGARNGLAALPYAVATPFESGGDIELEPTSKVSQRRCTVRILIFRLPQHDLLAVANGGGIADHVSTDECAATVTATLVRGEVSRVLRRQLEAKR
jgi:hypothetical protein